MNVKDAFKSVYGDADGEALAALHEGAAIPAASLDTMAASLDTMAEQINSLGAEARRLVERMDDGRSDDENYKGYTIYPAGDGSKFAVGLKGIIQKNGFASVEAAKKWIDSK